MPCFAMSRKRSIKIRLFLQVLLFLMERRWVVICWRLWRRHDKGEVPQVANCGLEFLGNGGFVQEELADVCCPGDKFIFQEGDYQLSKVEVPTKDDLRFCGSRLCSELVPCIHALAGRGFFWMIWACGCIHCKEGSGLCTSNMVGAGDVDSQVDDVINVDVVCPSGLMGMSTIKSEPCPKGIETSRSDRSGTKC